MPLSVEESSEIARIKREFGQPMPCCGILLIHGHGTHGHGTLVPSLAVYCVLAFRCTEEGRRES